MYAICCVYGTLEKHIQKTKIQLIAFINRYVQLCDVLHLLENKKAKTANDNSTTTNETHKKRHRKRIEAQHTAFNSVIQKLPYLKISKIGADTHTHTQTESRYDLSKH